MTNKIEGIDGSNWNINEIIFASMIVIHFNKLSALCQAISPDFFQKDGLLECFNDEKKSICNQI